MRRAFLNRILVRGLILAITTSPMGPGGFAAESCENLCGVTSQNAKEMIQDPACKSSESCSNCVASALTTSQAGAYCSAYSNSEKGKAGQIINASINTAATITCGTACAMGLIPGVGTATMEAWNRVCGFSGLAVTTVEIGYTIANLVKGQDTELLTLATTAVGVKGTLSTIGAKKASATAAELASSMAGATTESIDQAKNAAQRTIGRAACWNVVTYGIAAASKIASISKMNDASKQSCEYAKNLAGAPGGTVQSCLAAAGSSLPPSSGLQGLFTPTADTFKAPTLDDVNRFQATTDADRYLKEMLGDLKMAEGAGKFSLADIAKRIKAGESASSIMAGAGLPESAVAQVKTAEDRIAKGDRSPLLAHLTGGGAYVTGEGGGRRGSPSADYAEMAFGEGATPGEGAGAIEIERAPAKSAMTLFEDGDVFHSSFPGTIFDIVSLRIRDQKGSYAEVEPQGRMNRVFNGYSDPKNTKRSSAK